MEDIVNNYQTSIDLLNDAVRREIASSMQYIYFHIRMEDAGYEYVARYMHKVAIEEMRHVEMLAERILFLGGDVDLNPIEPTRQLHEMEAMFDFAVKRSLPSAIITRHRRSVHRRAIASRNGCFRIWRLRRRLILIISATNCRI